MPSNSEQAYLTMSSSPWCTRHGFQPSIFCGCWWSRRRLSMVKFFHSLLRCFWLLHLCRSLLRDSSRPHSSVNFSDLGRPCFLGSCPTRYSHFSRPHPVLRSARLDYCWPEQTQLLPAVSVAYLASYNADLLRLSLQIHAQTCVGLTSRALRGL